MWEIYRNLILVSLTQVLLSTGFYFLKKKTSFKEWPEVCKQLVIGLAFGGAAILGTEFGVDVGGATVNVRDAAPLCAGLFFGGPAGLIAGAIGGVERWFAAAWGAGMYSRLACSLSTVLAGVMAALLRWFMFEDKKPTPFFAFLTAFVMEVLHLTILFITHFEDVDKALEIVKICTLPMILCNSLSVLASSLILYFIKRGVKRGEKKVRRISQQVQLNLILCIIAAYLFTTTFVYLLQTNSGISQAEVQLRNAVEDLTSEVTAASDKNILEIAFKVMSRYKLSGSLDGLAEQFGVQEINCIDKFGVISESTNPAYIGFDMEEGEQSATFLQNVRSCGYWVQPYTNVTYNPEDDELARKYAGVSMGNDEYLQVGYDLAHLQEDLFSLISDATRYRKVGVEGYVIVAMENGQIISDALGHTGKQLSEIGLENLARDPEALIFSETVHGAACRVVYEQQEGFFIIAAIPDTEVFAFRDNSIYINSFMEVLVFAALFFVIYNIIRRRIVNKLQDVNRSLGQIIDGDLSVRVNVCSSREFVSLSEDINSTVTTLKHYIDEASSRIDQELSYAKTIQHSSLPSVFPAFPERSEFDIYALMDTAKQVGGDFYDFYLIGEDQLAVLIADVSGKGIPAAMFMMRAKSLIKSLAERGMPVNDVLRAANEQLCEGNEAEMFVTAWLGVLNTRTGHVSFANAGHNPPLVCRRDGSCEFLKSRPGFVLGGMPGINYRLFEFTLVPGDRLLLYTDGIPEAVTPQNEMFGEERLCEFVQAHQADSVSALLPAVIESVDAFAGDAEQFDDMTLLALDYFGNISLTERVFPASIEKYSEASAFLEEEMERLGIGPKLAMKLSVAFEELFVNVAHYAYPDGNGEVTVSLGEKNGDFVIGLRDSGIPFNPLEKEDPDITLSAEERQIGGLGIFMVKKTMDKMEYRRENGQNILTAVKRIDG